MTLDEMVRLRYQAQGFSFLPRQPIHSVLAGQHASRLRGRGLDFEELRRYLPGDDIRMIDWKATNRMKKPFVRVYTEERDRSVICVVDQRLSMFFGSQVRMKSVTAAHVAALSAWRVLSMTDRVGAVIFNDTDIVDIKPYRSRKNVMQILQHIKTMNHRLAIDQQAQSNPDMLNEVLDRLVHSVSHDYLICIISDLTGASPETKRLVTQLARHNNVIVSMIYDPLETTMPQAGRLVISDGQLQMEMDTQNQKVRIQFADIFNKRLNHARDWLGKRGIPVLPLHTAEDVAVQVRALLGYSPRTRRGG